MSKTNLKAFRVWQQMKSGFIVWMDRANSRMEMQNLNDRALRDIGLSRGNERTNSRLPF